METTKELFSISNISVFMMAPETEQEQPRLPIILLRVPKPRNSPGDAPSMLDALPKKHHYVGEEYVIEIIDEVFKRP